MRRDGLYSVEGLFREETKRIKKRKKVKATLSFAMDDEGDAEGDNSSHQTPEDDNGEQVSKRAKFRKNPNVDTSFLPDREREEAERKERERLRQEWIQRQEELKQEEIEITYSYWDGSGHRKSVVVCSPMGLLFKRSSMASVQER
jgi:protein FAM50